MFTAQKTPKSFSSCQIRQEKQHLTLVLLAGCRGRATQNKATSLDMIKVSTGFDRYYLKYDSNARS